MNWLSLSDLTDIFKIAFLGVGAYAAVSGLHTWKRQLKGKHKYELAKSLLLETCKYREAFNALRNPFVWNFEYPTFIDDEAMSPKDKEYKKITYVYKNRWSTVQKLKPKLGELILESEIIFGEEIKKIYDEIAVIESEVRFAIHDYIEAYNPDNKNPAREKTDLIFSTGKSDPTRIKIESLVNELKNVLESSIKFKKPGFSA